MNKLLVATLVALAAATLDGCVVARATGQAVVTDVAPDNHLQVVVVPGIPQDDGKNNLARITGDKHMATLFPQLATRLPQDFKANGVDAAGVLLDVSAPVPAPSATRTLVIRPTQAGYIERGGGSWLDLAVTLNDATHGVLWRGSIRMSTGTPADYDASAVDHAAVPLMEQLRDARMIDISWRRPTTP